MSNPTSYVHRQAAVISERRLIAVDGDGVLWSWRNEPVAVTTEQIFAVLVLWGGGHDASWLGWLTTFNHRAACFSAPDLEDPLVERWLGDLPDWDRRKLSRAMAYPGLHLVWRRGE